LKDGGERPFWAAPLPALLDSLAARPEGLSADEAEERLSRYGEGSLRPHRRSAILDFLARFREPLVIILLVSSGVSAALGDVPSFAIITVVVLLSVTLDFAQERRATMAADALGRKVETRATVMRDGREQEVPLRKVVPGDVVLLRAGDLVPADGRLLSAKDLFVNQALFTGEPYPVDKSPGEPSSGETDLASASNALLMGSSVISGTASMLVCRTGARTMLGEMAASIQKAPPPTEFERGTREFGLFIARLSALLVLFVMLVNLLSARPLLESFLFAVALAVGLTPELLPMVLSVTLARGAMRMAEKKVIVKRPAAIQNLGSMNVLCTDKTGTLTEAKIRLEKHIDGLGRESERVLFLAYLNSFHETGLKSPMDEAILAHEHLDVSGWAKIDEVPFDFERRRVSVLVDDGERRMLVVKGAFEDVLRLSTQREGERPDSLAPLDEDARAHIEGLSSGLGEEGFRVLGIAWKEVPRDRVHAGVTDEAELCFAGLAAFLDPPKASATEALRKLGERGVKVKIVTGDNELVTRHVCRELGIEIQGVLTGAELAKLDDMALSSRVETTNLFCRVTPAQKTRVLLALKGRGHVVGFLGDGINDAPALRAADVGISVDSAVDVAKEAAEMILLEQDLRVLYDGVLEGRRTFGNVMKYVMMGTSSNFGNMFSMAGASLILPFLPMLPSQILLNNLLYDISEVPIPLDEVDEDVLATPHRFDIRYIRRFMMMVGPMSSIFDFVTFWLLSHVLKANEALFHTGWFIESIATQVLVIFVIRTRKSPLASKPSRLLVSTSLLVVGVAVLLPYTPLGAFLRFVPPPGYFFGILAALVVAYLLVVEGMKRVFYRVTRG
jgi:Mg2+-importing ATPase